MVVTYKNQLNSNNLDSAVILEVVVEKQDRRILLGWCQTVDENTMFVNCVKMVFFIKKNIKIVPTSKPQPGGKEKILIF